MTALSSYREYIRFYGRPRTISTSQVQVLEFLRKAKLILICQLFLTCPGFFSLPKCMLRTAERSAILSRFLHRSVGELKHTGLDPRIQCKKNKL